MLPAVNPDAVSLADVLTSSFAAMSGQQNRLGLSAVDSAVVVLVDGLGLEALKARSGHARNLMSVLTAKSGIDSGFPTTTAAALASLATGTQPGQHGLVGYSVLDTVNDRLINQLSGWDSLIDPATWQRQPTVFERASAAGVRTSVVGPGKHRDSGFTHAVLRGAHYESAASIDDRMQRAVEIASAGPSLTYVYVSELDMAAHARGWQSPEWTAALETADAAIGSLARQLGPRVGLLVTADHGMVDVPPHGHILFDTAESLIDGVRFVAGEPRCLQVHFEPGLSADARERLVERWRESESGRSWVVTRNEAIDAGWFGAVDPEVAPRIGDLLIAARKSIAYYDSRTASDHARAMIGQHGSWTSAELRVPLLRYAAFAR